VSPSAAGIEPRDLARLITMRAVIVALGGKMRGSKRADCLLCRGSSRGTVAVTPELWRCHRCCSGGDQFELVKRVHRCDFPTALRYVADLAGIQIERSNSPELRHQWDEQRRRKERLERAAQALEEIERDLRVEIGNSILDFELLLVALSSRFAALLFPESSIAPTPDHLGYMPTADELGFKPRPAQPNSIKRRAAIDRFGEESIAQLDLVRDQLRSYYLPAYRLLSAGPMELRTRFVLYPDERSQIASEIASRGYVVTEEGRRIEVGCE
jgi:hypothetical protein